jgi:hypothetical protein
VFSVRKEISSYVMGTEEGRGNGKLEKTATFMCRMSWNLGASTSWNLQGLSRLVMGLVYLNCSPNTVRVIKSRRMRWARHVARTWESIDAYRVLVGKSEGKSPLGRKWEDNIKVYQEIGWGGRWTELIWLTMVGKSRLL